MFGNKIFYYMAIVIVCCPLVSFKTTYFQCLVMPLPWSISNNFDCNSWTFYLKFVIEKHFQLINMRLQGRITHVTTLLKINTLKLLWSHYGIQEVYHFIVHQSIQSPVPLLFLTIPSPQCMYYLFVIYLRCIISARP